ncbi:TKL family protein kinase [Pelomyxa schiedti]|nr:TKL family protein kinase [Pelomyxa schiedti]
MFHGSGVRLWANGDCYDGEWVCGKENGTGKKKLGCDGTSFDGVWEMGVLRDDTKQCVHGGGKLTTGGGIGRRSASMLNFPASPGNLVYFGGDESGNKVTDLQKQVRPLKATADDHVLKHIQQGCWVKNQTTLSGNTKCVMKEVSVTLHNITFHEDFCCLCPFDKIVKMEIEKRFGIDENHQVVSAVTNSEASEVQLSGTSSTLSELSSLLLPSVSGEEQQTPQQVQVKVRITPIMVIQETDLWLLGSLGSGSYGIVLKGVHIPSSRNVAVKTLHQAIMSESEVEHFKLEAEIVSGLRHPNIVECLGTCTTSSGRLLIVSELMCCSLRQLLSQRTLKFHEVTAIALGVAKGMDALHRQKYMHRDLSSNNVLLGPHGTPKICDFGVSRGEISQRELQAVLSNTRGPGTPVYMSPQMFTTHYTSKGDVWSFGVLTTEMTCGGIVDTPFHTLPLAEQSQFLAQQKMLLPPLDAEDSAKKPQKQLLQLASEGGMPASIL